LRIGQPEKCGQLGPFLAVALADHLGVNAQRVDGLIRREQVLMRIVNISAPRGLDHHLAAHLLNVAQELSPVDNVQKNQPRPDPA